jgi:hypothetical protein
MEYEDPWNVSVEYVSSLYTELDKYKYDQHKYDQYKYDQHKYDQYKYDQHKYDQHKYDQHKYDQYKYDQHTHTWPLLCTFILILSPRLPLSLPSYIFSVFRLKLFLHLSSYLCVLHISPISFSLIGSP